MKHSIQDSQVDLCGELGHEEEDDFPPLALGDTFSFSCRGCGGCCKDRQDIVLSGYDLYRLCARLQLPPELVLNAFCRVYTGKVSLLPVARLQPREDSGNNCPFLFNNRCSVHEAKPLVCALYPLGQTIELNGTITYFCQDSSCGGPRMEFTLQDYLDSFSIRQREPLDLEWARLNIRLSKRVKKAAPHVQRIRLKIAQRKIYRALYLDYDFAQPYPPQLEENLAKLWPALDHLLGPEEAL